MDPRREEELLEKIPDELKQQGEDDGEIRVLKEYTGIIRIDWKSHLLWFLSVTFFILSRLWWLVPLPGARYLPPYRTYPSTFLNTTFLSIAYGLAARSLPVALIQKPFTNGIHPTSVVDYGETGGYRAIWSAFRHRSGLRYFFVASLVTIITLLSSALEGELQSSVTIYYKSGSDLLNMNTVECRHLTDEDYQAASYAFGNDSITHTLKDASYSFLNNHSKSLLIPTAPYKIDLFNTLLTPLDNATITRLPVTQLRKRHGGRTTTCLDSTTTQDSTLSISSTLSGSAPLETSGTVSDRDSNNNNNNNNTLISNSTLNHNQTSPMVSNALYLLVNGQEHLLDNPELTQFNQSNLNVSRAGGLYTPYTGLLGAAIPLRVLRHDTPDSALLILYSPESEQVVSGVSITTSYINHTCHRHDCFPYSTEFQHSSQPQEVADALARAIESNIGRYGTQDPNSLVFSILNPSLNKMLPDQSGLADALMMNPLCPASQQTESQGYLLAPYSAGHWTVLGWIWFGLLLVCYLIGAYLIGYTEEAWSRLARTGRMIPQIIHNSSNLFEEALSAKLFHKPAYLDQPTGKMNYKDAQPTHGYSVTTAMFSDN